MNEIRFYIICMYDFRHSDLKNTKPIYMVYQNK